MWTRYVVIAVWILAAGPIPGTLAQTKTPGKTVWSGVYAAEQAARGEEPYKARCARCHGAALEGTEGNGLAGRDFMERWREDTMQGLFEFVSENMPYARPGQGRPLIGIPTYLDIVAFILSKNDFPAGTFPLSVEGLDDIQIQYKDGPRPLPNGALVRISGCLTGAGQDWSITAANDPVKTRTSDTTDYPEFKAAEDAPAGTRTYKLFNLGFLSSKFKPENFTGARLMVKGNLIRQADSMRISVLGVRKIGNTCP